MNNEFFDEPSRWWWIFPNVDGTFYLNEYHDDESGMTRRDTIGDGLTHPQAKQLISARRVALRLLGINLQE